MPLTRSLRLFAKAEAAFLAALELYNKPDFFYREEVFAILMSNAWELSLKAKLLLETENRVEALYTYQDRATKRGAQGQRRYVVRNRAGNPKTIGMGETITALEATGHSMPQAIRLNLDALTEVRDNAVHYLNRSNGLSKRVLELGTASVRNFVGLAREWFDLNLNKYNLYLLPMGFVSASSTAMTVSRTESRLMDYLTGLVNQGDNGAESGYSVAIDVTINMRRAQGTASTQGAAAVMITNDPSAPRVTITEEEIRKQFSWDYSELCKKMRGRYPGFKENAEFHSIRKGLMMQRNLARTRYLDPAKHTSSKKDFYSPNILQQFDKHYLGRAEAAPPSAMTSEGPRPRPRVTAREERN